MENFIFCAVSRARNSAETVIFHEIFIQKTRLNFGILRNLMFYLHGYNLKFTSIFIQVFRSAVHTVCSDNKGYYLIHKCTRAYQGV